jgi:hypothetical protein
MSGDLTESADKLRTVSNLKHPRKTRTTAIKLPPKPREGQGKEASGKVGARYQSRVHPRHLLHGGRRDARYLFDTGPALWSPTIYISTISKQDGECRMQREWKGWKAEGKCRVFSLESADKLRTASSIKSRARTTTTSTRTPKGRGVRRVGARIDIGSVQDICSMVEEETLASVRYWTHRVLLTIHAFDGQQAV